MKRGTIAFVLAVPLAAPVPAPQAFDCSYQNEVHETRGSDGITKMVASKQGQLMLSFAPDYRSAVLRRPDKPADAGMSLQCTPTGANRMVVCDLPEGGDVFAMFLDDGRFIVADAGGGPNEGLTSAGEWVVGTGVCRRGVTAWTGA